MSHQTRALAILILWQVAERHYAAATEAADATHWRGEMGRLQDEYAEVVNAARAEGEPEPPPFPVRDD